jgi:hypothetical protein
MVIKIAADVRDATGGMVRVEQRFEGVRRSARRMERSMMSLRKGLALLAGAAGAAYAAKRLFDLGAAVEETASKFRTVLGPEAAQAQDFLDGFATTAGLTAREGQELVATTAAMAEGMGLSGRNARVFAQDVVRLAGDLSSFNNIPIQETSLAIQAAVTGEREQLKRLGIVIRETDVQKRALANTGKELAKALTDEEKATATLQLITERAGDAVGDLARTQDSAANKARQLRGEFGTIAEGLSQELLPAFADFLTYVQDSMPTIRRWADEWGAAINKVVTHFSTMERFDPAEFVAAGLEGRRGLFGTGGLDRELIEDTKELGNNLDALKLRASELAGKFQVYRALLAQADEATFLWDARVQLLAQHVNALERAMMDANTRIREFQPLTPTLATDAEAADGASGAVGRLAEALNNLAEASVEPVRQELLELLDAIRKAAQEAEAAAARAGVQPPSMLPFGPTLAPTPGLYQPGAGDDGLVAAIKTAVADGASSGLQRAFDLRLVVSNLVSGGLGALIPLMLEPLASLFGADPVQVERNRILKANTEAVQALAGSIERQEAVFKQLTGAEAIGLARAIGPEMFTAEGKIRLPVLRDALERLGLTMADLERIAAELDIEWNNSAAALRKLDEALESIDISAIFAQWSSGFSLLQQEFALLDIQDPAEQFARTIDFLSSLVSEDLAAQLRGLDATNIDEFIRGVFEQIRLGDLSFFESLGDLTIDEFLQGLGFAESALDKLAGTSNAVAGALRNVPAGFKVALARYRASEPEAPPSLDPRDYRTEGPGMRIDRPVLRDLDGYAARQTPTIAVQGDINIHLQDVHDPRKLLEELEEEVRWRARTGAYVIAPTTRRA